MDHNLNLARFVSAQASVYDSALAELQQGKKRTHWMWFIFPQLRGLGRSSTAQFYGLCGREEAIEYLDHPLLGPRLVACTETVNAHQHISADHIFGYPDTLKFRSCMTLFAVVAGPASPFAEALRLFFAGEPDDATLRLLVATKGTRP